MPQNDEEDPTSDKAEASGGLEFVLVEQPTKRASGDVRRRVRSHVTRLQHQRTRERETLVGHSNATRPFISYSNQSVKQSATPTKPGKVAKVKKEKDAASSSKRRHTNVVIRVPRKGGLGGTALTRPGPRYWANFEMLPKSDLGIAFSRGTMSFKTFALDDATNTVGMSLEALGLDVASVLGCYKLIVQIQAKDFEDNYCTGQTDIVIWERFYEFVFTDPVLLTVALLITIRYRLECLGYRNRAKDFMQVLQLEDFLIKRVNAALKQPGRAVSDPMLVAVALCAAYEVKNGNPSAYHIHMKGLLRMIDLRGGLAKIGEEDPYLERLLIWHDVNTSQIIGHEGYIAHLPNSLEEVPGSNLATFTAPIETDAQSTSEESSTAK